MDNKKYQPVLKWRILIAYAVFLVLIAVIFLWALSKLSELGDASQEILKENYNSIIAAENMVDSIERQDSITLILFSDYSASLLEDFKKNEQDFLSWLKAAAENETIQGEGVLIEKLEKHYNSYLNSFYQFMVKEYQRTGNEGRRQFYLNDLMGKFHQVREACIALRNLNQHTMFLTSERTREIAAKSRISLIIVGSGTLLAGFLLSLLFSHLLTRPMQEILEAIDEISRGNYNIKLGSKSKDEFGQLAAEFNRMSQKLQFYQNLNIKQILTETKKNEAIINKIDDGVIVVNEEMKITNINTKAADIFHMSQSESLDRHFLEVIKEETLFKNIKSIMGTGKHEKKEGENLIEIQGEKGIKYYQYTITPLFMKKESVFGAVVLITDITKFRILDKMKSEFVMAASHELKTPLTGMQMSVDLLKEKVKGKELTELVDMIGEEISRLSNLVSDLLNLSKMESGQLPLNFELCPFSETLDKALSVLENQVREKGIKVDVDSKESPPFYHDTEKIVWVLVNLIGNALRYTEEKGKVAVKTRMIRDNLYVTVRDFGPGISPEDLSRVFDRFFQTGDKEKQGASGLGLSISREIIHAHKGTIWVESEKGNGAAFTFTLPMRTIEEEG